MIPINGSINPINPDASIWMRGVNLVPPSVGSNRSMMVGRSGPISPRNTRLRSGFESDDLLHTLGHAHPGFEPDPVGRPDPDRSLLGLPRLEHIGMPLWLLRHVRDVG